MPHQNNMTIQGTVIGFNVSPKGFYESMLLDVDSETVQVNFPPEEASLLTRKLKEGNKAELAVEPEESNKPSDHSVYKLVDFGPAKDANRNHEEPKVKIKGKVVRLNYAKHGEINGAVLDNGCFVHLKPEGAKEARLKVGQLLEVEGEEKPAPTHRVVEVYEIDNKKIRSRK